MHRFVRRVAGAGSVVVVVLCSILAFADDTDSSGDVVSLTGSDDIVSLAPSTTIAQIQGGTSTSPQLVRPFSLQPVDTKKAPFGMAMGSTLFSSTYDDVLWFGYNVMEGYQTEPTARWTIEQDYEPVPGTHWMEAYLEVGQGSTFVRPLFSVYDRAAKSCKTMVQGTSEVSTVIGGQSVVDIQSNAMIVEPTDFTMHAAGDLNVEAGSYITIQPGSANNQVLIPTQLVSFRSPDQTETIEIQPEAATIVPVNPALPGALGTAAQPWGSGNINNLAYTPANPTNWQGTPPKTIQEALDRIAAVIGPIP